MRATLSFTLPEDESEYIAAAKAMKMATSISEFRAWLRKERKYTELTDEQSKYLDVVSDMFWETFSGVLGDE